MLAHLKMDGKGSRDKELKRRQMQRNINRLAKLIMIMMITIKMMIIQMNAEKCNELKTNAEKYQLISNVDNDNDDNDKSDDNTNKCREMQRIE